MTNENKLLLARIFAAAAIIAATVFGPMPDFQVARAQTRPKPQAAKRYVCPMHPEVTSTEPRRCPKCGMALRRVKYG